jgi:transposase
MRYELSDCEWAAIKPMLPNEPCGAVRANDRRVLNGIFGCAPTPRLLPSFQVRESAESVGKAQRARRLSAGSPGMVVGTLRFAHPTALP